MTGQAKVRRRPASAPPRSIPDPPPGLRAANPDEWRVVWHRVRVGAPVKAVGYALAQFADWQSGAEIFPGNRKLALASGEQSTRTVMRALDTISELGLIWCYARNGSRGGKRGCADEYRLTIPDEVLARVPMLTPALEIPSLDQVTEIHLLNDSHQVTEVHQVTQTAGPGDSDDTNQVTEVHPTSTRTSPLTSTTSSGSHLTTSVEGKPAPAPGQDLLITAVPVPPANQCRACGGRDTAEQIARTGLCMWCAATGRAS